MKKLICILVVVTIMVTTLSITICSAIDYIGADNIIDIEEEANYAEDRVIVVLDNDTSLKFNEYVASDFASIGCKKVSDLSSYIGNTIQTSIQNIFQHVISGEDLPEYDGINFGEYNQILCLELEASGKSNVISSIEKLLKMDGVLYACPDYVVKASKSSSDTYIQDSRFDTSYLDKIQLFDAWDITTGSNTIRVGVLDTGIKEDHPDLINNINSTLCRDFSGGGIANCSHEDGDPEGHGTHVAGIIGAEGDNDEGISGVCWDVELISLRVIDSDGYGLSSYVFSAINYAAENNFDIINMSVGWDMGYQDNVEDYNQVLNEVIGNFNGLVVCAAGNDYKDIGTPPVYPASYNISNLITVGATGTPNDIDEDEIWYMEKTEGIQGSNYGKEEVELFAPGYAIWSTCGEDYDSFAGTSQAAPMVTGVAALMLSVNPNLSPEELKHIIMEKTDSVPALTNLCISGGRLNAYNAVNHAIYHSLSVSYNSSIHTFYCNGCGYTNPDPHDLYMNSEAQNAYHVKCATVGCGYEVVCSHTPVYEDTNTTEHKVSCPNSCYTDFYESHGVCTYEYTESKTTHNATCQDCGHTFSQPHDWIYKGSVYRCTLCGITSTQAPSIIQNLPPVNDEEDLTE